MSKALTLYFILFLIAPLTNFAQNNSTVSVQVGADYKNIGVFNPDNNYIFLGQYNRQNYYVAESIYATHFSPYAKKHTYFRLNSDLSGEMQKYASQKEGPSLKGAELTALGVYGFEAGKVAQIYQDIDGKNGNFKLYRAVLLPDGNFENAVPFPEENPVASNLSFTWRHHPLDNGKSHLIYGFQGVEKDFKRYYNRVEIIITDEFLRAENQYSIALNTLPSGFVMTEIKMDKHDDIYLLGYDNRIGKEEDEPIKYRIFKLEENNETVELKEISLDFKNKFPSYADVVTSSEGNTIVSGIYQNEKSEIEGLFYRVTNQQGEVIKDLTYTPFGSALESAAVDQQKNRVLNILSGSWGKEGNQFKFRKIHSTSDGGHYFVYENNFEYMQGQPGMFNHFYAYKDKLVVKFASDFTLEWARIIPVDNLTKIKQYGGFLSVLNKDTLYLILPDDAENNDFWNGEKETINEYTGYSGVGEKAATALITVSPEGTVKYEQIKHPSLEDAFFMPANSILSSDERTIETIWYDSKGVYSLVKPGVIIFN